jgi:hypothetical protein
MKPKLDSHRVMELTKLVDYALQKGKPATHFRLFERTIFISIGIGNLPWQTDSKDHEIVKNAIYQSIKYSGRTL